MCALRRLASINGCILTSTHSHRQRPPCWFIAIVLTLALMCAPAHADRNLILTLGDLNDSDYLADLLSHVLEQEGYQVTIERVSGIPNSRLEWMLGKGDISVMMLGQTPSRDRRFLPIKVAMTDHLIGKRILFIPRGQQQRYDGIRSTQDLWQRNLTAGMGKSWLDYLIWTHNDLPVTALDGDWKRLFRMVSAGNRGVDYLPRGANEIALEWPAYPQLDVEENLVFSYPKDHILYVSPRHQALYRILQRLLPRAESSGLIRRLVRQHYSGVFRPPINLNQRRLVPLAMPELGR